MLPVAGLAFSITVVIAVGNGATVFAECDNDRPVVAILIMFACLVENKFDLIIVVVVPRLDTEFGILLRKFIFVISHWKSGI